MQSPDVLIPGALIDQEVMIIPDFVANCGGVLASNMLSKGFDVEDVQRVVVTTFAMVVTKILEKAHRQGRPVGEIACALAWQNHRELHESAFISASRMGRVSRVLRSQGLRGIWRRLAWRVHHRWPGLNGVIRRAAIERYTELRLGAMLTRVSSEKGNSD